jgi:hypothetical protein
MKPPYGTQIITQHDGSIMLKFETAKKELMILMLEQAIEEIKLIRPSTPPDALTAEVVVSKVVPDLGPIPMTMVAPPPVDSSVAQHMQEANRRGQSNLEVETESLPVS